MITVSSKCAQILAVPLWSQNAGGAYETFLAHTSFITRSLREARTTTAAINTFFIPQLKTLIDLANTPGEAVSVDGLEIAAQAIAEIYCFFQVGDDEWMIDERALSKVVYSQSRMWCRAY